MHKVQSGSATSTEYMERGMRLHHSCLGANEDINKKETGKALTDKGGLGMKEVVGSYTGKKIGHTFFRGKLPIDSIWATPNIIISNACIVPAGYGIGDQRLFVINIHTSLLIGTGPPRVQRAASRRLNTRLPHIPAKYFKNLKENIQRHRLIEEMGKTQRNFETRGIRIVLPPS
jgi:hypothetical protein